MIHSDLRIFLRYCETGSKERRLFDAFHYISELAQSERLWFPTYNYDFTSSGLFSVQDSPSQVGVLTEFFRLNKAVWRTETPIFSIAGVGPNPDEGLDNSNPNPFAPGGAFSSLIQDGGSVLLFGGGIRMASVFHLAELAGGGFPVYRFKKEFAGVVIDAHGRSRPSKVAYQVSPLPRRVLYDWERIARWALNLGLMVPLEGKSNYLLNPQLYVQAWVSEVSKDPFWPLDEATRTWVEPLVDTLGRGFKQHDFE